MDYMAAAVRTSHGPPPTELESDGSWFILPGETDALI